MAEAPRPPEQRKITAAMAEAHFPIVHDFVRPEVLKKRDSDVGPLQTSLLAAAFAGFANVGVERRVAERRGADRRVEVEQVDKKERRKAERRGKEVRRVDLLDPFRAKDFESRIKAHLNSPGNRTWRLGIPPQRPRLEGVMDGLRGISFDRSYLLKRLDVRGEGNEQQALRDGLVNAYNAGVRLRGGHWLMTRNLSSARPRKGGKTGKAPAGKAEPVEQTG